MIRGYKGVPFVLYDCGHREHTAVMCYFTCIFSLCLSALFLYVCPFLKILIQSPPGHGFFSSVLDYFHLILFSVDL